MDTQWSHESWTSGGEREELDCRGPKIKQRSEYSVAVSPAVVGC